jgi:hypothetical protein
MTRDRDDTKTLRDKMIEAHSAEELWIATGDNELRRLEQRNFITH